MTEAVSMSVVGVVLLWLLIACNGPSFQHYLDSDETNFTVDCISFTKPDTEIKREPIRELE